MDDKFLPPASNRCKVMNANMPDSRNAPSVVGIAYMQTLAAVIRY